jgi:hypothetical protein
MTNGPRINGCPRERGGEQGQTERQHISSKPIDSGLVTSSEGWGSKVVGAKLRRHVPFEFVGKIASPGAVAEPGDIQSGSRARHGVGQEDGRGRKESLGSFKSTEV